MLEFLPTAIKTALARLNIRKVYELRLRADKPVTVNYEGVFCLLGTNGVTKFVEQAVCCTAEDIANTVYRAGKYSVYAIEEQIRRGFITAEHGERIGIAGTYVFDKGQPLTVRAVTSLCIRVPHEIIGCGQEIYASCMRDIVRNVLICSPPGLGKTTILRDISRILCFETRKNVLVCDERGELSEGDIGLTADVMKFSDKKTAFDAGIRAMRPDIIVTDELSEDDIIPVRRSIQAGIKVIASAHFDCISNSIEPFKGVFDRYVILDTARIGRIAGIYDKNGEAISYDG